MSGKVTYRQQFTRCGKQQCRTCRQGAGHGPYWYAYWSVHGRTVSKYLGKYPPEHVETGVEMREQQQALTSIDDGVSLPSPPGPQSHNQKHILLKAPLPVRNVASSNMETASGKQPAMRIYLLGQFRIENRHGMAWQTTASPMWQRHRARALLGCLLSNTGRRLTREQSMKALWPDLDMEVASNRINGAVHELRRILEPGLTRPAVSRMLRLEQGVLQLAGADLIWVDADIFESLLNNAHETSDPVQAEQILEEAARLYGGDYLLEELYAQWATTRRESLRRDWIDLLLTLAELRASRDASTSAIEALDRLLATDPTHEIAVRRMMLLLTRLDRRGEALQVYHRLADNLQREYESNPLPETYELYETLRQGYVEVSHPVVAGPITNQATTITGEVQHELHARSESEFHQHTLQALPCPALRLERQDESPLVGRDQELTIMRKYMFATEDVAQQEAQKDRSGEIVSSDKQDTGEVHSRHKKTHFLLLMGESGIGKTRLAEELSQEANARGWSVAWAHANEQESEIPFLPWTGILRSLLQSAKLESFFSSDEERFITPSDNLANSIAYASDMNSKLAKLRVLLPELADYGTLTPPRNASLSPSLPEQEKLHLWEATLALLSAVSRLTPILLVLDDLHRTDESSLALLAYLVRNLQGERILLVGTCRDAELATNSNLRTLTNDLRREQSIAALSLHPLTPPEIGSLLAHLPKDLARSIQILAGGNPFFAKELALESETSLLSLADPVDESGHIPRLHVSGEEAPSVINRGLTLPESITAVLERRLSELSNDCQALLGKALALGSSFEFNQLFHLLANRGLTEDATLDLLEEALHAGFLTEERRGASITYHFKGPIYLHKTP